MGWKYLTTDDSKWAKRIYRGGKTEYLWGYLGSSGHGHAVYSGGRCRYKRDVDGLDPVFYDDRIFL